MTMEGRKRKGTPRAAMIFLILMITFLSFSLGLNAEPKANYDGWRIIEVVLDKDGGDDNAAMEIMKILQEMEEPSYLEILRARRDKGVAEVAASPEALQALRQKHRENVFRFSTTFQDLGKKLEMEGPSLRASLPKGEVTFDQYMDVDEILAYVEDLPNKYPSLVTLEKVGDSIENRPIYLVTLTGRRRKANKPIIFVDGGIHAREWISPASVLYLIEKLLQTPSLTRGIEWQIMPLLNPDGYAFSWSNDRLWRKNRARVTRSCTGTDLNRNFGFHWGESGSSGYPCSTIFKGKEPFSEPESKALRDAMVPVKDRIEAYITVHSYGQYILYPWGYTTVRDRFNDAQLHSTGEGMAKAIKRNDRTIFQVGTAAKLLYPAAGASDDWVAGELKIPLVYTLELRDEGVGGFVLPADQIIPAVTDVWVSLNYLAKEIQRKEGVKVDTNQRDKKPLNKQALTRNGTISEEILEEESVESTTDRLEESEEIKSIESAGWQQPDSGDSESNQERLPAIREPTTTSSTTTTTEYVPTTTEFVTTLGPIRPSRRTFHRRRYYWSSEENSSSEESSEESDEK